MTEIEPVTPTPEPPPAQPEATPSAAVPPPVPPRKSRKGAFALGAAGGCLLGIFIFSIIAAVVAGLSDGAGTKLALGEKVAVIPIEGEIFEARDTIDALHRHAANKMVRAIVIRINSPGGAVAPSQEIFEEIRKVRESSRKPIVASFDNVAASGGYYIAAACDEIVSNPGSITGSIGVILQWMEVKDLIAWAKMKPETITSGEMKDAGSPFRDLTDAERAYLQRITAQLHQQFIKAVFTGRKGRIAAADLNRIADGRVFTGEEALQLKLVDRLGNLDDAVNTAAKLAGMSGKPSVLYPKKRKNTLLDLLSDNETKTLVDRVVSRRPGFLYRW
jgi:protease-4